MEWLRSDIGVQQFKANVVTPVSSKYGAALQTQKIVRAKVNMAEFMLSTRGAVVEDNIMVEFARYFSPNGHIRGPSVCRSRVCGAGKAVIGVSPKGDLLPCGRFEWNDHENTLGHIGDAESVPIYFERVSQFLEKRPESWQSCDTCRAKAICSYGCQAFITRSPQQINVECAPTQLVYDWIKSKQSEIERFLNAYEGPWRSSDYQ